MSEDPSSANDGAGIWRDPSGIITLGESGHERHTTGHKIIVICDSHTSPLRRLIIRRSAPGEQTRRGTCPGCGRMATIKIITEGELWNPPEQRGDVIWAEWRGPCPGQRCNICGKGGSEH